MPFLRDLHRLLLIDKYATLPHQLELPFDGKADHCPVCNPSDDPRKDMLRSMCSRHWREHEAAFDKDAFHEDMEAALEEGRRAREAAMSCGGFRPFPDGGPRFR